MATGAIEVDNSYFRLIYGTKIFGTGISVFGKSFNSIKIPLFKALGTGIKTFVPKLGANRYLRIGTSTSKSREVFRITIGTNKKHWLDIDLGKIPKIK